MKKVILILVFGIWCLTSCKQAKPSEKNKITGSWEIVNAYIHKTDRDLKFMSENGRGRDSFLKKELSGTLYHFSNDGKVTIIKGDKKDEGNWQMSKDDKTGDELSGIEMNGTGWVETWLPATGSSLFYLKGIDNAINAILMPLGDDGKSVVLELSKRQ